MTTDQSDQAARHIPTGMNPKHSSTGWLILIVSTMGAVAAATVAVVDEAVEADVVANMAVVPVSTLTELFLGRR